MSAYLDEHIGVDFLVGSDKSMVSMGGCTKYRPDKLYVSDMVIMVECDEHQHAKTGGDYSCDERRISELFDEFGGSTIAVIRWNPDGYESDAPTVPRKERLARLVALFNEIRENKTTTPIHIWYMWYDDDNPNIAENIPYTMIR
jgi:hypothetical protein